MNDQEAMDHVELSSGTFAIVGCTKTGGGGGKDLYLQVSDPEGEFIVGHTFGLTEDDIGYSITETTDGFFVCGSYGSTPQIGAGNKDVFIVRCDSVVDTETEVMTDTFDPTGIAGLSKQLHISVFPNPAFLSTRLVGCQNLISAQLLDPQGRLARQWIRPVPQDLDLQGLSSGAYQLVTTNEAGARSSQTLIIAAP